MMTQDQDTNADGTTTLPAMRAIQAFEAIARSGSVAAAADELGVSPGAVSQQLRKIENELGVRLFERDGRSLALTSWGRVYYEKVRMAFDELRLAQHKLHAARARQNIVVSALPSLALWLQRLLLDWRIAHPSVSVRLIGAEIEPSLRDEYIDFRICYGADARRYDRFSELFVDAVVPVCSPELLRSHPVKRDLDVLTGPLIDVAWDLRHRAPPSWSDWAWAAGLPAPAASGQLSFSLSDAAIDAAMAGGGFVLGQVSMIAEYVRQGRLVIPVDRRLSLTEPYYLAWERDALDRPSCGEFRNAVIAAARLQNDAAATPIPPRPARR